MTKKIIDITPSENDDYPKLIESIKRNMDLASKTVLIVDDEKGIRMKVAREVKAFDPSMVIYEATNGSDALDTLDFIRMKHLHDPLLIVLDLNMPFMDGWEVINRLKKEYESNGKDAGIPYLENPLKSAGDSGGRKHPVVY
jgi:CheY-like chemotaxis protein